MGSSSHKITSFPERVFRLIIAGMTLTLAHASAHAQADFEKGFQGYQSYHGSDFDTVNLANGNLVLDIPLLSYEQRGGLAPIVISIRSNGSTFQATPPYSSGPQDTKQFETPAGIVGAPWGQPHISISPGGISWKESRLSTNANLKGAPQNAVSRFVALDESGATHSLGANIANSLVGSVPGIRYSVDGSGLMLQPGTQLTGPLLVDRNGNTGGLIDTNGNAITLNGSCAKPAGSGDAYDPSLPPWQGYAHGIASATSITDSVGRVIPNPTYLAPYAPYSCLVDMSASYHPPLPTPAPALETDVCETWNFPAEGGTVPLVFCYIQHAISASIPTPFGVGASVPSGASTSTCPVGIPGQTDKVSCETINETWWLLHTVTLPNQTKWQFLYDSYGQVSKVIMPTGAVVAYVYAPRLACGNPPGETPVTGTPGWPYSNLLSTRMVTLRRVNVGDGSPQMVWTYNTTVGSGWAGSPNSGTVTVTDPLLNDTVHNFSLIAGSTCGPYETSTQVYEGPASGGKLLKETDTSYSNTGTDYANPTNFSNYIAIGVLPAFVTTTVPAGTGYISKQNRTTYDSTFGTYQDYVGVTHPFSFGELLSATESDWVPGPHIATLSDPTTWLTPLRTTLHTHYWQSNWNYYAANLIDLPCLDTVYNGASTTPQPTCTPPTPSSSQMSQTAYGYDEPSYMDYPGTAVRGNGTSVSRWLQGSTPIVTRNRYQQSVNPYGLPSQKIDAKSNVTNLIYDSSYLFLAQIQHPSTTAYGQTITHNEGTQYDLNTGLLLRSTDENGLPTNYTYDSMRRLQHIAFPDGGWESYTYNDAAPLSYGPNSTTPAFTYTKLLNSETGDVYVANGIVDQLGRNRRTIVDDSEGDIYKDTTYDQLGRVFTVTNPYRLVGESTDGHTTSYYDALSRKVEQILPDTTSRRYWCYDGAQNPTYAQPNCHTNLNSVQGLDWVDVQDENTHDTQSQSDGLGRLRGITDANNVNTMYTYDVLGNLTQVAQPGTGVNEVARTLRSFSYDSLSRLLQSSNPETGVICYGQMVGGVCMSGYDANGNLLYKTDARGITINYTYDQLNRLIAKSYSNDTSGTASSCYQYDASSLASGTPYLIGRLANAWTQKLACSTTASPPSFTAGTGVLSRRSIQAYDAMGRVLTEQQCTYSNCASGMPYTPAYTYDVAGNLLKHNNGIPSNFPAPSPGTFNGAMSFTNTYDTSSRLKAVVRDSPDGVSPATNLFTAPTYSPAGGLTSALFGTGLQLNRTYDVRLRILSETDKSGGSLLSTSTPGTATIQIYGAEQTH